MKTYLLVPFILFSILVNSQTSEVIGESISAKQNRVQYVENELIRPKRTEFDGILKRLNLYNTTVYNWQYYSSFHDVASLNQHIIKYQKIVNKIKSNPKLFSLCNEINSLEKQINKNNYDNCKKLSKQLNQARLNVSNAKARLNELKGIKTNETKKQSEHENIISEIDKELKRAKNKTNSLDEELKKLNKNGKKKSINDFLAKKNNNNSKKDFLANASKGKKRNNDFLAKKNNGQKKNNDFLAKKNNGGKKDFLSESNTINKDFKIEEKNGLIGVVDSKGKTLIPFKEWVIEEYKNGIAKVRVLFDEYKYEINSSEGYHGTVYKIGFVDVSGSFLDEPLVSIIGGCYGFEYRLRFNRSSDTRSQDEINKSWARYDRKRELLKKKCFNKFTQWKINTIRKYQ